MTARIKSPEHPIEAVILDQKKVVAANMLEQDSSSRLFGRLNSADWVAIFDGPQLQPCVPVSVQKLFEQARAAMIYGWCYYPLLTMGFAECTRVLEAGARHAAALVLPSKRATYDDLITNLHAAGWITDDGVERWSIARKLRNSFAHPTDRTILVPAEASMKLRGTSEQLNDLFARIAKSAAPLPSPTD